MKKLNVFLYLLFILCVSSLSLRAQTPNPDQNFLNQQQREEAQRRQLESASQPAIGAPIQKVEEPEIPQHEEAGFQINHITLNGDESEKFQWLLKRVKCAEGRKLGGIGLNAIMTMMQNDLVKAGYITSRILILDQELSSGEFRLTLALGRLDRIIYNKPTWRSHAVNTFPNKKGDILRLKDIEQALETYKRVPTADANIEIKPSEKDGYSDLLVDWNQPRLWRVALGMDDSGNESTGKLIGSATISVDNLLTMNDLFYFNINHDLGGGSWGSSSEFQGRRDLQGYAFHYSIPWDKWLLSLNYSESTYHQVIKGLFTDSIYSGFNSRTEIGLNYILYRDSQRITTAGISGWYRISENLINGAEIPVQRRKNAALVYELKHQEFLNWGNITANLQYIHGINAVDAIPAPEETTGEGTWKPRFWNFDLTLNRPFKWDQQTFNYSSRFSAQWNETPLIPQDRFTIGNRWTVRGFEPDNSLFSERGWFWQNELSWVVPVIRQQLYAAVDYGEVDGPSADRLVGRRLMGAALGLRGGWKVFNYDVFLSTPIIRPASYPEKELLFNFRIGMNY